MDSIVERNPAAEPPSDRQGGTPDPFGRPTVHQPALRRPTLDESTLREPTGPGDPGFGISVSCRGDRWTVRVSGEVDAAGAAAVLDVAEVLAARQVPAVDLDFSQVTAIDALSWRAALYAKSLLSAACTGCRLISPPSALVHPSRSPGPQPGHAA